MKMSTRSALALSASRKVFNPSAEIILFSAYIDKRSAFSAGIHSPTLAALHTGRSPLWDRQAMEGAAHL